MEGEASFSWRIHGLGHPWIGLTSVCGSGWRLNLSVNAICEISTTTKDGGGQLLAKIWLVGVSLLLYYLLYNRAHNPKMKNYWEDWQTGKLLTKILEFWHAFEYYPRYLNNPRYQESGINYSLKTKGKNKLIHFPKVKNILNMDIRLGTMNS